MCSTRLSTAGLLPGLHIVSVGALLRPGLCGLLRLRVLLRLRLCLVWLVRLRLPRLRCWAVPGRLPHGLLPAVGGVLLPPGGVGGAGSRILPPGVQGALELRCALGVGWGVQLHGVQAVVLPGRLLFLHKRIRLQRVGPQRHRLGGGDECGHRGRVVGGPPEEAPRFLAVADRVGAPGQHRVGRDEVNEPYGQSPVGDSAVGELVKVHLLVQVLTAGEHFHASPGAIG